MFKPPDQGQTKDVHAECAVCHCSDGNSSYTEKEWSKCWNLFYIVHCIVVFVIRLGVVGGGGEGFFFLIIFIGWGGEFKGTLSCVL